MLLPLRFTAALAATLSSPAQAGERFLGWSYGADTVPQGGVELEHYLTVETHHEAGALVPEWVHQVELEYGLSGALEAGLYIVASQTGDEPLSFSAYKARLRYRFWPLGMHPVDMAGYLEYTGTPSFSEHGLEAKWILSHEGEKLRAALNLTGELSFAEGSVLTVLEPTLGLAWRLDPHLALGLEGKTETAFTSPVDGPLFWTGPTLHLAGEGGKLWWTLSGLVGLTPDTRRDAAVEARSLLGIEL